MKKTMKTLLVLMAGVVAFSACSKEALINENTGTTPEAKPISSFIAITESDGATRAAIDGLDIKWQSGDAILMMDGTNNSKYNLTAGAGTTSGTFSVDEEFTAVSGENIYALYPYTSSTVHIPTQDEAVAAHAVGECAEWPSEDLIMNLELWKGCIEYDDEWTVIDEMTNMYRIPLENQAIILAYLKGEEIGTPAPELSGSSISKVTLPVEQTVADGQTVDPKAVLMVAKAEAENNISFKNVCSYVKVTPTVACKKIVVRANNGEKLAGIFTVSVSDEPSVSSVSEGSNVVTLKAAEGDLAAGTYYIAVLPGILSKGLEVNFYTVDGPLKYNARYTSYTFERNKIHNGGDNSGAVAAYWTQHSYYEDLFDSESYKSLTSVTINTDIEGSMPAGAKALNEDETVWVRVDGTNAYIETTASKIMATNLESAFMDLQKVTNYYNLDKIDVSEAETVTGCFNSNYALLSLDLSSWQISSNASTYGMFSFCNNLSGLTLNNNFHSGDAMFFETGRDASGGCTVFGVTDNAVKADLKNSDITYWDDSYMKFDGE